MGFRARYKREVGQVYLHYYDMKWLSGEIMKAEDLHEVIREFETKKFEKAIKVFPVIDYIHDFCVSQVFKNKVEYNLTKEDKLEALDIIIADTKESFEGVHNLFKGTAKETEKKIRKELEALEWYREKIKEEVI